MCLLCEDTGWVCAELFA
jgi:hypothetical protein